MYYPGLPSHPQHELAQRQMRGFGGMIALDLNSDLAGARRFFEAVQIFALAESLGGVESLISPATRAAGIKKSATLEGIADCREAQGSVDQPGAHRADQNIFSFGATSGTGSFFAVWAFQPPPRALYRFTSLTSCDRRSVISDCCALNN